MDPCQTRSKIIAATDPASDPVGFCENQLIHSWRVLSKSLTSDTMDPKFSVDCASEELTALTDARARSELHRADPMGERGNDEA